MARFGRARSLALLVALAALFDATRAPAFWIDKRVTVQPIQVCSTDGQTRANPGLTIYEAETDKIWAQAGIVFRFLPVVAYSNSTYLNVSSSIFDEYSFGSLAGVAGHGQYNDDPNGTVINLFFVRSIDGSAQHLRLLKADHRGLRSHLRQERRFDR